MNEDPFIDLYKNILTPPETVYQKEFIFSGQSYGDVFELAAGLKKTLSERGTEKVLCLCTMDKAVVAASILASLAGYCKLVLPYSFSASVIKEMYDATGFDCAIADHPEEIPTGVEIIKPRPAAGENIGRELMRNPDEPFLRLFTGGSTGKPKVWSKSPRNLLAEAFYLKKEFALSDKDIFVATVPPYHIYGLLFSVLVPFVSHSRILPNIFTFPQEIISAINNHNASVLISVPIHYRALKVDNLSVPSLKSAFSSAGALDRSDGLYFYEKTGLGITEIYGSTETGGIAYRSNKEQTDRWKVFDVVSWKLNGSRLSVKSDFVSCEMERDENGFCMTGDEARKDEENSFILLGRADGIVKVAGKRVDLLDVENKIKTLAGVSDALVVAIPTDKGRKNVIAAVVACDITESRLKNLLTNLLESYAVPRRIKIVSSIARTTTGKIDRRRIEKLFSYEKE